MRKAVKFMAAGCALFLLLAVGFVTYMGWELRSQPPSYELPALARDLPGPSLEDAQKEFRERVRKKFPDGTSAQSLAAELQRQGFKLSKIANAFMTESVFNASIEQQGFPCARDWTISWHKNQDGQAENINGSYVVTCL